MRFLAVLLALTWMGSVAAQHPAGTGGNAADQALNQSQAALGRTLPELGFTTAEGIPLQLDELRGKPLLVSMIFTSCYHVCPTITRNLATAVRAARDALGEDSFNVVTIGFDTANDSPMAMRAFAREQSVSDSRWYFLSADPDTIAQLSAATGFSFKPTPRGFDHINQLTVVDRDGVIYRQVYGADFDLPWLVEPLKELVWNRPQPGSHVLAGLADRVKLFCTVFDPRTGRYRFDYSLFVGIGVGLLVLLLGGGWWARESWMARRG